jgi:hypothetical protein
LLLGELVALRWPFRGRRPRARFRKVKHKPVCAWNVGDDGNKLKAKTYLWALAWIVFKVGCCVEYAICLCLKRWRHLTCLTKHQSICLAFQAYKGRSDPHGQFDSNSIPVGVDNHALRCLAQDKHLFENLTPLHSGCVGSVCVCVVLTTGSGELPYYAVSTTRLIHPLQCLQRHNSARLHTPASP